jgi:hypothetical protein
LVDGVEREWSIGRRDNQFDFVIYHGTFDSGSGKVSILSRNKLVSAVVITLLWSVGALVSAKYIARGCLSHASLIFFESLTVSYR